MLLDLKVVETIRCYKDFNVAGFVDLLIYDLVMVSGHKLV